MNEQLRQAIEEATRVVDIFELYDKAQVDASQAKLLRVIELLVEQRNQCRLNLEGYEGGWTFKEMDAELIAALEADHLSKLGQ